MLFSLIGVTDFVLLIFMAIFTHDAYVPLSNHYQLVKPATEHCPIA